MPSFPDRDTFDLERELRKLWSLAKYGDHSGSDDEKEGADGNEGGELHVRVYDHYRTQIGSPSINRHFLTQDELNKFISKSFTGSYKLFCL